MVDMHDLLARLRASTDTLLSLDSHHGMLMDAAETLRNVLGGLAEWDDQSPDACEEISLDAGIAIAPVDAARCILDFQRTTAFLRGVMAAVTAATPNPDGVVDVLYAGCGPLAPLAVALCHRLPQARFWPVDIHGSSVDSVRRVVERAGYGEHFGDIACADAIRHQWPVVGDVAVVEVMQSTLEKEPQIAITANLANQLRSGGVLVPECVALDLQLHNVATEFGLNPGADMVPHGRVRVPLAPLLRLRADSAAELMDGCEVSFDFSDPHGLNAMISTRIDVYGDICLGDYDSGLTTPWTAFEIGRSGPGRRAKVTLVPGPSPRWEATLL